MDKEFSEEKDESLEESVSSEAHESELQSEEEAADEPQVEELPDPLTQCTEDLAAEKDQRLRIAAEFANYRRRMESQRVEWSMRAKASVIRTLLPIIDDLERSLTVAGQTESEDGAFKSLQSGINLVHENFLGELEKLGLKRIQTLDEVFDEHLHEAVGQAPAAEGDEGGRILHESLAGYRLGDQVLRHAKVIVAVAPEIPISVEADAA